MGTHGNTETSTQVFDISNFICLYLKFCRRGGCGRPFFRRFDVRFVRLELVGTLQYAGGGVFAWLLMIVATVDTPLLRSKMSSKCYSASLLAGFRPQTNVFCR